PSCDSSGFQREDSGRRVIPRSFTIGAVNHAQRLLITFTLLGISAAAQQATPPAQETKPGQPQVRVNYLNVCTPSDDEKAERAATLAKLRSKPKFAVD